ncbi:excinuclease ABC subunit UvrC [Mycoplasmopsis cricetuli]|uniref:excinuclease ABC subunit UvrC n=1 Tax=Mycoplasmopsis cricetuli TaxID=171283 RepID=UPI0004709D99|nr:excinuclease ABC subunit UvrC [Mycoplasmopsis cricetuli]
MNLVNNDKLTTKLKTIPQKPGVYLWKDQNEQVIYVGKAVNLRNRVNQYLKGGVNSYKTYKMVEKIADIDFVVCKNEKDALLLEKNYIEKYKPKYNILLLDDKNYSYIKILLTNKLGINTVHKINHKHKNVFYYGPITAKYKRRELVKILQRLFLYKDGLPIVKWDNNLLETTYQQIIDVLKLKNKNFIEQLEHKRDQAAMQLNFEIAKEYQDSIKLLQEMKEKQVSEISNLKSIDIFSVKIKNDIVHVFLVCYRFGIQTSHQYFFFWDLGHLGKNIDTMFEEYYKKNEPVKNIILDNQYENVELENLFVNKIIFPKKGELKNLIDLANINNDEAIKNKFTLIQEQKEQKMLALEQLKILLRLKKIPRMIYIFDNSNLNNSFITGVGMAFANGVEVPALNRKFRLENIDSLKHGKHSDSEYMFYTVDTYLTINKEFFAHPDFSDLFIVDGSKAQISAFRKALANHKQFNYEQINLIGLVKNDHHKTRAIVLKDGSEIEITNQNLYNLLSYMQIKVDEYAKSYFNKIYRNSSFELKLTQIKGVGVESEKKLIAHFQSYSKIYNASFEELSQVVSKKVAAAIKKWQKQQ